MKHFLKYFLFFSLGFFTAKFLYKEDVTKTAQEEIQVVLNSIENVNKLVVSKGSFSEIYNYTDSKKYFYDYVSFDKKAIISVNANVEVGYDLSKLEIQVDSIAKKIIIHKIPKEEIIIVPTVKYYDLQQSSFNSFSKKDLNNINAKSIEKIKETAAVAMLKEQSKNRLLEELSKVYQLSALYGWEILDNTNSIFLSGLKK